MGGGNRLTSGEYSSVSIYVSKQNNLLGSAKLLTQRYLTVSLVFLESLPFKLDHTNDRT